MLYQKPPLMEQWLLPIHHPTLRLTSCTITHSIIYVPYIDIRGEFWDNRAMDIGYARVSTLDQTLDLQKDALTKASCGKLFTETASGSLVERKKLEEALEFARPGDTIVVWRLDRLGRSLRHLIETVTQLEQRGIGFRSLTENIDTTSSSGKLVFHIFGALAEFERELIRERTQAGLSAARARGRKGGRPRVQAFSDSKKLAMARSLYNDKEHSVTEICKMMKVGRTTFYRYINQKDSDSY
jgi:DNA invertase Pin-like site-specific DNA recombinase